MKAEVKTEAKAEAKTEAKTEAKPKGMDCGIRGIKRMRCRFCLYAVVKGIYDLICGIDIEARCTENINFFKL